MTSIPLATAATLYHRFYADFSAADYDPHVCILLLYHKSPSAIMILLSCYGYVYIVCFGMCVGYDTFGSICPLLLNILLSLSVWLVWSVGSTAIIMG
jgi:hypothetical protein